VPYPAVLPMVVTVPPIMFEDKKQWAAATDIMINTANPTKQLLQPDNQHNTNMTHLIPLPWHLTPCLHGKCKCYHFQHHPARKNHAQHCQPTDAINVHSTCAILMGCHHCSTPQQYWPHQQPTCHPTRPSPNGPNHNPMGISMDAFYQLLPNHPTNSHQQQTAMQPNWTNQHSNTHTTLLPPHI